jgi:hypothetical protein
MKRELKKLNKQVLKIMLHFVMKKEQGSPNPAESQISLGFGKVKSMLTSLALSYAGGVIRTQVTLSWLRERPDSGMASQEALKTALENAVLDIRAATRMSLETVAQLGMILKELRKTYSKASDFYLFIEEKYKMKKR